MFRLKKALSSLLVIIMLINTSVLSFATDDNKIKKEFVFDNNNYSGLTLDEIGKEKLLEAEHTEDFINCFSDKTLKKIGTATEANQITSYYKEELYNNTTTYLKSISIEKYQNDIKVNEDNEKCGYLKIKTTLYLVKSELPSNYLVISEFLWSTPPQYRGIDYLGITRDSNTVSLSEKCESYFAYSGIPSTCTATQNGIVYTPSEIRKGYQQYSLPNQCNSIDANVVAIKLPEDIKNLPFFIGATGYVEKYYNMRGGVAYEGVLKYPKEVTQYFSHWSSYLHQTKRTSKNNTSLSIPIDGSLSIKPTDKYSTPVVDKFTCVWTDKLEG